MFSDNYIANGIARYEDASIEADERREADEQQFFEDTEEQRYQLVALLKTVENLDNSYAEVAAEVLKQAFLGGEYMYAFSDDFNGYDTLDSGDMAELFKQFVETKLKG